MQGNLLELQTNKLLEKFGAGNHKPGSGSAVALQGMLSAQLIRTVINLTNDPKRNRFYKEYLSKLLKIDSEIESQIYPDLEKLLLADSVQFDKVIKLRQSRENAQDLVRRNQFANEAILELKDATEIPIQIANHCIKLAEFASFVFDHAFKAARGDSSVALNGAVSSIAGCLSIIDLNLLSFTSDEWTEKIRSEASQLRSHYKKFALESTARQEILQEESNQTKMFYSEINALRSGIRSEMELTNMDIENIATSLQLIIWRYRSLVWKNDIPESPIEILRPEIALKKLGYQFQRYPTLGIHEVQGDQFEIAGIIDKQNYCVSISEKFTSETQAFTCAHELGHALLHQQNVLHRDRPLDGSSLSIPRNKIEQQADKFAAHFLMPRKQVKEVFQLLFLTQKFVINDETMFALNERSVGVFKMKCKNLRGLSRFLASVEYFNGIPFYSISKQFRVSVGTMAIRLEELELLDF